MFSGCARGSGGVFADIVNSMFISIDVLYFLSDFFGFVILMYLVGSLLLAIVDGVVVL